MKFLIVGYTPVEAERYAVHLRALPSCAVEIVPLLQDAVNHYLLNGADFDFLIFSPECHTETSVTLLNDIRQRHPELNILRLSAPEQFTTLLQALRSLLTPTPGTDPTPQDGGTAACLLVVDASSGVILDASASACEFYGWSQAEMQGKTLDLLGEDLASAVKAMLQQTAGGSANRFTTHHQRASGASVPVEITPVRHTFEGQAALYCTIRPLSPFDQADILIHQTRQRVIDSLQDGIWVFGLDRSLVWASRSVENATGYTLEELQALPRDTLFSQETLSKIENGLMDLVECGDPTRTFTLHNAFTRKDGATGYTNIRFTLLLGLANQPVGFSATSHDITRQRLTEEELLKALERLNLATEGAKIGIWDLDLVEDVLVWDQTMHDLYGLPREDFGGNYATWRARVHPDDIAGAEAHFQEALHSTHFATIFRIIRPDGEIRWLQGYAIVVTDDNGAPQRMVGTNWDITDLTVLGQREREQREFAEGLLKTISAVNTTQRTDEMLHQIVNNIEHVIPHDGLNVILLDSEHELFYVVENCQCYKKKGFKSTQTGSHFPLHEFKHLRKMLVEHRPLIITDTRDHESWVKVPELAWVRSYMGAPICHQGNCLGVLNLESATPGAFTIEDSKRLQAFADQVAVALQSAQLYSDLERYNASLAYTVEQRTAELQAAKERVESILSSSPVAIALLDKHGTIQSYNPVFCNQFGYAFDELFHRSLLDVLDEESITSWRAALHAVTHSSETQRFEVLLRRRDGALVETAIALASVSPIDPEHGLIATLLDISHQKEVERMKDRFVSNVSHELRTPISSMVLSLKLLTKRPERSATYIDRLERDLDRLDDLIEDLLRLSRLDQGRVELQLMPVDLHALTAQYVEDRRLLAANKGLKLLHDTDGKGHLPAVLADEGLVGQALSVLLTNAINYTPEGGVVTVVTRCEIAHNDPNFVRLCVMDTGPGIVPEELPLLFNRFFRGSVGHDSQASGTGLGLSIAQEIIKRHGGRVEAANREDGPGACFTIWLPVAK